MPDIETDDLVHTAVVFPVVGVSNHGDHTYGRPFQINVRWIQKVAGANEPKKRTNSFDVTLVAAQPMATDCLLWKGLLADFPSNTGPVTVAGLHRIDQRTYTDDIRGAVTRFEFTLKRYKNKMPSIGLGTWNTQGIKWNEANFRWNGYGS